MDTCRKFVSMFNRIAVCTPEKYRFLQVWRHVVALSFRLTSYTRHKSESFRRVPGARDLRVEHAMAHGIVYLFDYGGNGDAFCTKC